MDPLEILLIVLIVGFVVFIFGRELLDKENNIKSGECKICSMKSKRTLEEIREVLKKDKKQQNS